MKRPFDYIGKEPIDINNPEHQKVIIKRDQKLNSALFSGLNFMNVSAKVSFKLELDCLKCGTKLEATGSSQPILELNDPEFDLSEIIPDLKCLCCGTKYKSYYHEAEDILDESRFMFKVKVPKEIVKVTTLK